jgi:CarD family transcriptional regulator
MPRAEVGLRFKKGDTVIYPQHGACVVQGTKKMDAFGEKREYLVLQTVIYEMTLKVPVEKAEEVGIRPPVSPDELEDLVAVLAKPDPRVPSNWSRRFKNHQEKLKSGDVYQVAEVVRNLAARNRDASLSAAERTMYEKARLNLVSEISPALKVSSEAAEEYLDGALAKGVLKEPKGRAASTTRGEATVAAAADAEPVAKKPAPKTTPAQTAAKKAPAKKAPAKKAPAKKAPAKKAPAKKAPAKAAATKTAAKKTAAKKTAATKA